VIFHLFYTEIVQGYFAQGWSVFDSFDRRLFPHPEEFDQFFLIIVKSPLLARISGT